MLPVEAIRTTIRQGFLELKEGIRVRALCKDATLTSGDMPLRIEIQINNPNEIDKLMQLFTSGFFAGKKIFLTINFEFITNEIFNLPLHSLDVSGCDLYNVDFKIMPPLKNLNLGHCSITQSHIENIPPSVEELWLNGCELDKKELERLSRLSNLKILYLNGNYVLDDDLKYIPPSVEELILSCCQITNDGISSLQRLHLRKLLIDGCNQITDIGLYYLKNHSLTELDISSCNIDGHGLKHLSKMPLNILSMDDCYLERDSIRHIKGLPIHYLNVNACDLVDEDIKHILTLPLDILFIMDNNLTRQGTSQLANMQLDRLSL